MGSRSITRGHAFVRPGNDSLALALFPIYHAFRSTSNLRRVMHDIALEHKDLSRFDPLLMETLAEKTYAMSTEAQADEGRVRSDLGKLQGAVDRLNGLYKWRLVRDIAADWAPLVRYEFFEKEGERLGARPLYGSGKEDGLAEEFISNRLGLVTNQWKPRTTDVSMERWPLRGTDPALASGRPVQAHWVPARPPALLGDRGRGPGLLDPVRLAPTDNTAQITTGPERVVPGAPAEELRAGGMLLW
ncbi:hypothetical protein WJX74_000413 [Apatococcus lobatus]|uniref:Uncharacterized protein n=1 Tax=Apatococcus lobatus TaxID=904363 RepID=A0AAW1SEM0_9CHLO